MEFVCLRFFQSLRCGGLTLLFGGCSLLGETVVFSALVLLFFLLLPRREAWELLFSVLLSLALNAALKRAVLRPRPYLFGAVSQLSPPLSAPLDPYASFPSGHVQLVTTLCACLAPRFKFLPAVPVSVALSRMYFGIHYPSDVLWGLFLGGMVVLFVRAVFAGGHSLHGKILDARRSRVV